jgi:phosphoglucosamine mutase
MGRLFGTDGVRGVAGRDLTAELALGLGRAAVAALSRRGHERPSFVVGRDTRASGEFLQAAIVAGIGSAGGDVLDAGVLTTPGVAMLTRDLSADSGVVISASHNPPEYNGIKFFDASGYKLPDEVEEEIEGLVEQEGPRAQGAGVGRVRPLSDASSRYLDHLVGTAEASLEGWRIVVDCANGAACGLAPEALRRLGADVHPLFDAPDGTNINVGCGAMHPEVVAEAVVRLSADVGVAHDGDADRAMFADAEGRVIDGDQVLAACAVALREQGRLAKDTVVTTVMANLGFRRAMEEQGVTFVSTKVGDRYVLEEMLRTGAVLGGEQSGHLIFGEHATTGDGILTAIKLLTLAAARGRSLSEFVSIMQRYPQVLENVTVSDREALDEATAVWDAVAASQRELGGEGRILVRASGTEPLVRVMVEAASDEQAARHARAIAEAVREALGEANRRR